MLGMALEQVERVGQHGQSSAEGTDGSCGAAGKVEDEAGAQGAAEGATQNGQRRLADAFGAHQFRRYRVEQAFADSTGGLRSDIATADAGASGGDDETGGDSAGAMRPEWLLARLVR